MRSRHAFTFAELTIAMLVVGILAAVAAPRYATALASYRADCAARRICADLRLAQWQAKRSSAWQQVAFSRAANAYQLPGVAHRDHPGQVYEVSLESTTGSRLEEVDFNGSETLSFDLNGRPSTSGVIRVASGSQTRQIVVSSGGRIEIQ